MKKSRWILSLLMAGSLWIEPVFAETMQGKDNWAVSFTKDEKMASNFSTASIDDVLY